MPERLGPQVETNQERFLVDLYLKKASHSVEHLSTMVTEMFRGDTSFHKIKGTAVSRQVVHSWESDPPRKILRYTTLIWTITVNFLACQCSTFLIEERNSQGLPLGIPPQWNFYAYIVITWFGPSCIHLFCAWQ